MRYNLHAAPWIKYQHVEGTEAVAVHHQLPQIMTQGQTNLQGKIQREQHQDPEPPPSPSTKMPLDLLEKIWLLTHAKTTECRMK